MQVLSKTFAALSDPNRIRILKMLETRPLCVCEIRAVLDLATSTVSKHLSILRNAEFIVDRKEGKWVNFDLNKEQSNEYTRHLLPLLRSWLPNEDQIIKDRQKVLEVNRNQICGLE